MARWFFLLLLSLAAPAVAQSQTMPAPIVTAQLLLHAPRVEADTPIIAGVLFTLPEGWHIYWQNPGDSGIPTRLNWTVPEGISVGDIQWPVPEAIDTGGIVNYGYSEHVLLPVTLTPMRDGIHGAVEVRAEWLACKEICIPETATLRGTLPQQSPQAALLIGEAGRAVPEPYSGDARLRLGDGTITLTLSPSPLTDVAAAALYPVEDGVIVNGASPEILQDGEQLQLSFPRGNGTVPPVWNSMLSLQEHEEAAPRNYAVTAYTTEGTDSAAPAAPQLPAPSPLPLLVAVFFAFLGGVILNAMPCVLPILSLKALALAKKSGAAQRQARLQGVAYTAGVVLSFLAVAGAMLALKAAGGAIGWGFQLQEPAVIAGLALLMLAVAFNLFGMFELPVLFGHAHVSQHGTRGAFLTGALAVALATPCTAPFMAPALGATLTMSLPATLLIFTALGLGMAAPFLAISLWPAARRFLPHPGMWMVRFKQFLAFPMLATAAWLLWVLVQINGTDGLILLLTGAIFMAWLLWWAHITARPARKPWLMAAALLVALGCIAAQPEPSPPDPAKNTTFSEAQLEALRAEGTPVFVDATAAWCLTCKINERVALGDPAVQRLFAEKNIALLVADWTTRNDEITRYLARFGRNGVPLYVYYPTQGTPVVLPQLITPAILREAIAPR